MSLLNLLLEKVKTSFKKAEYDEFKWMFTEKIIKEWEELINEYVLFDISNNTHMLLTFKGSQYIRFYYKSRDDNNMIQMRFSNHSPRETAYEEHSRQDAHYYTNMWRDYKNIWPDLVDFTYYVILFLNGKYKIENGEEITTEERDVLQAIRGGTPLNDNFSYVDHDTINTIVNNRHKHYKPNHYKINWTQFENDLLQKLDDYI